MPLTAKGEEIKLALTKEYGEKKGEQVLYAGKNKGTFTGIDAEPYAKVLENARAAQREYSEAQKKYRARDIGDKEFLAAKKKYEKSEEEFSKARGEHPSQHKLDSDTLDRIADCADRLSARIDAMADADYNTVKTGGQFGSQNALGTMTIHKNEKTGTFYVTENSNGRTRSSGHSSMEAAIRSNKSEDDRRLVNR